MLAACGTPSGEASVAPAPSPPATTEASEPAPTASAPPIPAIAGVTPIAATPARTIGSGPALAIPADPSPSAPVRLSVTNETSALVVGGEVLVWGSHHEHVPYRVEHTGPVRLAGISDAVQVVTIGSGAAVLRANGSVVDVSASERGPLVRRPSAPPLAFLAVAPNGASCGVTRRGGEVHCWNGFGAEQRPRRIAGITGARRLALRDAVGAVVLADGTVRTFGEGGARELGTGPTDDRYEAGRVEQPVGLADVVDVAALSGTLCALVRDGTVRCWGERLGTEGEGDDVPTAVAGLDGAVSLHGGDRLLCARRHDGSVACIGEGLAGFPTPSAGVRHASPVEAPMARGALELAIGSAHACWLDAGGAPRCVGENEVGQLGETPRRTVVASVPGIAGATWVSAWGQLSCAGGPWGARCWGSSQWSLDDELPRELPLASPGEVRAAWITEGDACVLREGGVRECMASAWREPRPQPRLEGVAAIAGPCAEMIDGRVLCGIDPATAVELPEGPHRALAVSAAWGGASVCAAPRTGDRTTCAPLRFGEDRRVTLGDVSILHLGAPNELSAGAVPCIREGDDVACYPSNGDPYGIAGSFDELEGGGITCARAGGTVSCWGYLDVAQLLHLSGAAHPDAGAAPTPVAGLTDATALAVGSGHGCALRASGEVACFGDTKSGGVGGVPGWVRLEPVVPRLTPR